ncbi:hypothetical protein U1839_06055 [Sphingomonas sp. RT2P30]|uniref:hypothetical protein n=1 Tax=Parasphingomonas halimpatiens TaxID=3096162 RepID=UPI002FC9BFAC
MKIFTDAAMAAFANGTAQVGGAVIITCDPPVKVWSGYGQLTIGADTYDGIGDRALAQNSSASLGGTAQAVTLALSGVDPDLLPLLDAAELQSAPAVLTRLVFDGSGTTLLDHHVFTRGQVDQLNIEETPKGEATITLTIEGAARGLGRRGGRMRTDADQRLISATDGGMKHVSYAAAKTLYWGGQKPSTVGSTFGSIFSTVISPKFATA